MLYSTGMSENGKEKTKVAKTYVVMTILVETDTATQTIIDMTSKELGAFLGSANIVRCDDAEVEA